MGAVMSDEAFNNLEWETREASRINEELEGYKILEVDTVTEWAKTDGELAIEGVVLFLQARKSGQLKVVQLDSYPYLSEEDKDNVDPLTVTVAYPGGEYGQRER